MNHARHTKTPHFAGGQTSHRVATHPSSAPGRTKAPKVGPGSSTAARAGQKAKGEMRRVKAVAGGRVNSY